MIHPFVTVIAASVAGNNTVLLCSIDSQCFCDITQSTTRTVTDDSSCECSTLAPVFLIYVLNNFFTSLAFKININIWRFVALF